MHRFNPFLFFLLVLFTACGEEESAVVLVETTFPEKADGDYQPKGYLARVVFPTAEQPGRNIWVKGSIDFDRVRLKGSSSWTTLEAPFYTAYLASRADSTFVQFASKDNQAEEEHGLWVYPMPASRLQDTTDFSFLVFGCFQPFDVVDSTREAIVRKTEENTDASIRELFRAVGTHEPLPYFTREEDENLKFKDYDLQVEEQSRGRERNYLTAAPTLVLATGDQVYVDAAYDSGGETNPISGWEVGENPQPRLYPLAFEQHLDRLYRHFFSFINMQEVTARLPIIAAWDDHEIRDGWGSQGDEYVEGAEGFSNINPELKPYFIAARQAYIQHQLATAPLPPTPADTVNGSDLHLAFEANGIPIFVFDLRSQRNIETETVIDPTQMQAFRDWLQATTPGQEIIVMSSVPFFWKTTQLFQELLKLKPELRDDIADAWDVSHNVAQRDAIFEALLQARIEKGIKPILCSGDIHVGALNEVWYREKRPDGTTTEPQLFAYELVISGLSHKGLANQSYAGQLQKLTSVQGAFVDKLTPYGEEASSYSLEVRMLMSAAKLNFANIERQQGELALSLFLQDAKKLMQLRLPLDWQKEDKGDQFQMGELTDEAQAKTYIAKNNGIEQRVILDWKK